MSVRQRYTTVVTTKARQPRIEQITPTTWRVSVTESAHADAANFAVQKILASALRIPANTLILQNGRKNKTKTWEVR